MTSLTIEDLHVSYPGRPSAVRGISLHVASGEVLGLLGGNGAGKSTTMKTVAGVIPATAGQVIVGNDVVSVATSNTARSIVGFCPDVGGLPPLSTVAECVGITLASTDRYTWLEAMGLIERLDLTAVMNRQVSTFSHGMSRRVSVLLAVLAADGVLLLDEPFDGVDPRGADVIHELIAEHKERGNAVVVSTHQLDMAIRSCDRVAVMSGGRVVMRSKAKKLRGEDGARTYAKALSKAHKKELAEREELNA